MSKHAVVLAGGQGTRLRPYTLVLPKPLMPIGEFPILEVIIRQLAYYGFTTITLAVNHQASIIKAFFGDGEIWGVKIDYALEDAPLGTMGPLKRMMNLPENFLVMNGDILTDLDFCKFYKNHEKKGNIFTISSYQREHVVDYGVLEPDEHGFLRAFNEKPKLKYEVSMGVYILNRRVIEMIPVNKAYGFDNLMLDLITAGTPAAVKSFHGYWLDIGRPDDYIKAIEEFEKMRPNFLNE
jgi:NDP-sugar pyrophosphorylase family protein